MPPWLRERILDLLLVLALGTIISQRALRSVPQLFPGGAAIGDVLATLATGFVGAWFFNLINIRLPARRAKRAVLSVVGHVIAQYAGQARKILQDMASSAGLPVIPRRPDRTILRAVLAATNGGDASRTARGFGLPPEYLTWIQYMSMVIHESRHSLGRLDKAYEHLDPETVAAISRVDSAHIVRLMHNYPDFPVGGSTNMLHLEEGFHEYWEACSALVDRYNSEIYPLMPERKRSHLDADEQAAADGWSRIAPGSTAN